MYIFNNYDSNILGDTFVSWYDAGKSQNNFLIKDYFSLSELMIKEYGDIYKTPDYHIIQIHHRYFKLPETEFGYNDERIVEVEMNKKIKLATEWKEK